MRNTPSRAALAAAAVMAACALLLGGLLPGAAPARAQLPAEQPPPPQPPDVKEIPRLVRELGSEEYRIREIATARLGAGGWEAVAPVAKAAGSNELEVAIRAIDALQQLAVSEDSRTADAATKALQQLKDSGNHSVSWRAAHALAFARQWAVLAIEALGGHVSTEPGAEGESVVQLKLDDLPGHKLSRIQCRALKRFDVLVIAGGKVRDDDVGFLAELTGLRHLDLRYTQVGDAALERLAPLVEMQKLMLSGTHVSDDGLKIVRKMPKLRTLYLSGTEVGDASLAHLASLDRLEELNLSQCKAVTDAGCASLANIKSLKQLNLTGTQVGDEGLEKLAALGNLTGLYLHGTRVSDDGVRRLREALPECRIRH